MDKLTYYSKELISKLNLNNKLFQLNNNMPKIKLSVINSNSNNKMPNSILVNYNNNNTNSNNNNNYRNNMINITTNCRT